jgi:hypothetical protein
MRGAHEAVQRDLLQGGILGLNSNYINQYVKYWPTVVSKTRVSKPVQV